MDKPNYTLTNQEMTHLVFLANGMYQVSSIAVYMVEHILNSELSEGMRYEMETLYPLVQQYDKELIAYNRESRRHALTLIANACSGTYISDCILNELERTADDGPLTIPEYTGSVLPYLTGK